MADTSRTPVANATWLTFAEGGGYQRREWWSDEGWAWKDDYDITHRARPDRGDPVVHGPWSEADAFARPPGARLPRAATWDQEGETARTHPRGEDRAWDG